MEKGFQEELENCGQPTVKSATIKNSIPSATTPNPKITAKVTFNKDNKTPRKYEKEEPIQIGKGKKYQTEEIFSTWKHNLTLQLQRQGQRAAIKVAQEDPEVIFSQWNQNFKIVIETETEHQEMKMSRNEEKMLKNKQRQQRRSKKKNGSGHKDF
jgi:hypothetical protein